MSSHNGFKSIVRHAFEEWKDSKYGTCKEADELNRKIGEEYFDNTRPHFFTGDLNSKFVMVHLNPRRTPAQWHTKCEFENFNDYFDRFVKFGTYHYDKDVIEKHNSRFDQKQVRFLKPFGTLPFKGEKYPDLQIALDKKLQLELIPYGSPNFNYRKVGGMNQEHFTPFIDRILAMIVATERDYVIFCGSVFQFILANRILRKKSYEFKLQKNDGKPTISDFTLINIELEYAGKKITAAIAPQYAKQGYPVVRYAEKIKELYGKF